MAGVLQKAIRGAATAGAQLSMENHRARIEELKMERMRQYSTGERLADQEYRTSERVAGEKHDIELQKLQNEGRVGSGAQQGDIQLMEYLQGKGIASSPEQAMAMVREMDTDPSKVIIDIAKSMHAVDDSKPFDAHLKQAEADVKALRERMNPKKSTEAPAKEKPKGILNNSVSMGQDSMLNEAIDTAISSGGPVESKPAVAPKASAGAPQSALDYLKQNPNLKGQFKAKYGYLPDWAK